MNFSELFPQNIFLSKNGTRMSPYEKNPLKVKTVTDLPGRLFMGGIIKESFKIDKKGYSVRYGTSRKDTYFDLKVDFEERTLSGESFFNGISGGRMFLNDKFNFNDCMRYISGNFSWVDSIQSNYSDYNCFYSFPKEFGVTNEHTIIGFPDGHMVSIIIPIDFLSLNKIKNLNQTLINNSNIFSPTYIQLSLTKKTISFREGMCEKIFFDNDELLVHYLTERNVFIQSPYWNTFKNGVKTFNVDITNYNIVLGCFFQDINEVLNLLIKNDLLRKKSKYDINGNKIIEDMSWIVGTGVEVIDGEFFYYNDDKSMRIFYNILTNTDYSPDFSKSVIEEDLGIDFKINRLNMNYNIFMKKLENQIKG
jgi:hypothetical protein